MFTNYFVEKWSKFGKHSFPLIAAALSNASYRATEKRIDSQPMMDQIGTPIEIG